MRTLILAGERDHDLAGVSSELAGAVEKILEGIRNEKEEMRRNNLEKAMISLFPISNFYFLIC